MTCNYCVDVKIAVCILTAFFGMGSWLEINGVWVELPILVDQLPEGWNLPSYLAVIIQLANIGPIIITICNVLKKRPPEKALIVILLVTSAVTGLMLVFLWTKTSYVAGAEHSAALFVFMLVHALCDCTASVVFLPFMNRFKPQYMTCYFIGQGLSGFLPSGMALIQGVGQVDCVFTDIHGNDTDDNASGLVNGTNTTHSAMANSTHSANDTDRQIESVYRSPVFSVEAFFSFIFSLSVVSAISFLLLNHLPYCKTEHTNVYEEKQTDEKSQGLKAGNDITKCSGNDINCVDVSKDLPENSGTSYTLQPNTTQPEKLSRMGYFFFLLLMGWANTLTNGILPSIQTYACLPYGSDVYHFSVTLANIANPVACFAAFFIPVSSAAVIGMLACLSSGVAAYILTLAAFSPEPPLADNITGSVVVVASFVVVFSLLSFIKVTIATLFRIEGGKALLWCGAVTQLGSALGAAAMFVTVNVFDMFAQKSPCA